MSTDETGVRRATPIMKYFKYEHLNGPLRSVSQQVSILASMMENTLPDGAEKTAGLRKLLEAKDCFVRAALDLRITPKVWSGDLPEPHDMEPCPYHDRRLLDAVCICNKGAKDVPPSSSSR